MAADSDSRALQHRLCGFGLFLLFIGAVGMFGLQIAKSRIARTATWPSVPGKVVTSEVSSSTVKTGRAIRTSPIAKTIYTYVVNDKSYRGEGRRVVPMLHTQEEGTPAAIVARYPVGSSVTVYYDPNNPSDCLLTPIPQQDARTLISILTQIAPIVGVVGLLIAAIAGVQLWRERGLAPHVSPALAAIEWTRPMPIVAPVVVEAPRPPAPPRTTHWIVRGVATILGLGLLLFGTMMAVTGARMNNPAIASGMGVAMLVIFGSLTFFGAYLIWAGMRRPPISVQSA